MEFVCEHCGAGALRLVDVSKKIVKIQCMSCGKESMVERDAVSMPVAKPQTDS